MELKDLRNLAGLNECGMGPMPTSPSTPASLSVSAASGSELSGMLKDIMSLAGMHKVEPSHLGVEPAPMKLLPEPVKAVGPAASDGEVMRGIADKLNFDKDDKEMKADEAWDNTPASPEPTEQFDAEEYAHHENPPGAGKGRRTAQPNATVEEVATKLFADYENFILENEEAKLVESVKGAAVARLQKAVSNYLDKKGIPYSWKNSEVVIVPDRFVDELQDMLDTKALGYVQAVGLSNKDAVDGDDDAEMSVSKHKDDGDTKSIRFDEPKVGKYSDDDDSDDWGSDRY